jgi:hypothetical protein
MMKEENCIAIGWRKIGDLSGLADDPNRKERIRKQLQEESKTPQVASREANEIAAFVTRISDGDVVLAADGEDILAIGKVTGPYEYKDAKAPHRRPVKWIDTQKWKLPETEGLSIDCTPGKQASREPSRDRTTPIRFIAATSRATCYRGSCPTRARDYSGTHPGRSRTKGAGDCLWTAWHRQNLLG